MTARYLFFSYWNFPFNLTVDRIFEDGNPIPIGVSIEVDGKQRDVVRSPNARFPADTCENEAKHTSVFEIPLVWYALYWMITVGLHPEVAFEFIQKNCTILGVRTPGETLKANLVKALEKVNIEENPAGLYDIHPKVMELLEVVE